MSDFFLELSANPQAKKLVKGLGLPIPMPQPLKRARGPYAERPLMDHDVIVGGLDAGELGPALAGILGKAGANPWVTDEGATGLFTATGEAWGRPARHLDLAALDEGLRPRALVFDGTGIQTPEQLRGLYDFFHPLIGTLAKSGRLLVLGRPPEEAKTPAAAAASAGLEGFVRSAAKEVGKRGSTAQLIYVGAGAEERLGPTLNWILSARSAFVTGQPIRLTPSVRPSSTYRATRPLDGKVALITGGARGIGKATAEIMAAEGAHVVILDRPTDDEPASQVARAVGGSLLLVDVSAADAPQKIAEHFREHFGGVDIVVHNAGVTRDKTLKKMKPEIWDQALDINLAAVVRITKALTEGDLPVLRDGGRLICLSSVAGIAGNMGQTNYAASKSGIIGFVSSLAGELAPRGITVNAIAPGFIETRLTNAMPVVIREVARRLSALGQGGQPRDIGEAITFLSTAGADGITGATLRVCGGALVGA